MAKVKYIPCDIYKRGVFVFIGNYNELTLWVKAKYSDKEYEEFITSLEKSDVGLADFHWNNEAGEGIIRIPKFPKTPMEIAYTGHEVLHATNYILGYCGVYYDNEFASPNEAYTYLFEHLLYNTLLKEGYKNVE